MSIKQGEFLKELRVKNNLSQEKLGEYLGVSRQSISKWEQGYAVPDTENLINLAKLYNVSVDSILNCDKDEEAEKKAAEEENNKDFDTQRSSSGASNQGWFFWSYPLIMIIAYVVIGFLGGSVGWATGWILFLTIPIYYSAIYAHKRKNPLLFAYPFVATIIYLILGFFFHLWHPMWIVFLTIPVYYIIAFEKRKSNK